MATKTNYLELTLPANNEFNNTWDLPVNDNFQKIDAAIEDIAGELQSARFSKTTLAEFLSIAHFSDGTLKPSEEATDGRNSPVYGSDEGGNDYFLKDRLDRDEYEQFYAREGQVDLLTNLVRHSADNHYADRVLSGPKNNENQPNFMSVSGAEFLVNGNPSSILFNINGYLMEVKDDISVVASGADGTKYLVAKKPATPFVVYNKSTAQTGISTQNGLNNDKVQVLQDTGVDYAALKVRAGMILNILNTQNAGTYIIDGVAHDGNADQILIKGEFKSAIASINYTITDPLRPEFSVEVDYTPQAGWCYVGEGEFNSGALTSSRTYAFKGKFESKYESVDVSSSATQEIVLNHNLGYVPTEVKVFASIADDGSEPVEPMSFAQVGQDLGVDITNTLAYTPGTYTPGVYDPGTTDAAFTPGSYTEGSLDGDVSASINGSVFDKRSVKIKMTRTQIFIKNVRDNHLFTDYAGTDQDIGYLKVVCK